MAKPILKHEKQEKIRDYLWKASKKRVWDITDFGISSIKDKTALKEKEIEDITLDLRNEKALLYRNFNFDSYIPNTPEAILKLEQLEHKTKIVSYYNISTLVFLSAISVIIALLLVQSHLTNLIVSLIGEDRNAISIFIKGAIIGVMGLFLVVVILKSMSDLHLRQSLFNKKYFVILIIILGIILLFLYLKSDIQNRWVNIIFGVSTIIALILQVYSTFKGNIDKFLVRIKKK